MKLRSFGCSFVYGTDLSSPMRTWPALMSQQLGLGYQCHAEPGLGNLQIMESILRHSDPDSICVINWTWIDRFDFVDISNESWQTLRPALDHKHAEYYYRNLHAQYRDMITNLVYIKTAIDFLQEKDCAFIMTAMDDLLFEKVRKEWHDPSAVDYLQKSIRPFLKDFDGKNFLDWSRWKNFAVSDRWHPLEDAHRSAADFWMPSVENLIYKRSQEAQ